MGVEILCSVSWQYTYHRGNEGSCSLADQREGNVKALMNPFAILKLELEEGLGWHRRLVGE